MVKERMRVVSNYKMICYQGGHSSQRDTASCSCHEISSERQYRSTNASEETAGFEKEGE